ncbi:hypothetical protein GCM10025857_38680 [Alicyclobacillus contaminans]|uniref:hypothetical protein n=1 Tax=Alicyclobacillus contaminans TaxID=392016 RepID=UPI0004046CBB|nr:hypothetical protein [Alicyclobacillus contaminans]GMA52511.1 hypothetical protein GCM10025857_38680 [Alicyclobacillus contaminans]
MERRERKSKWIGPALRDRLEAGLDASLVPIAAGFLCMLCLVQLLTAIPAVRTYVDDTAGRFVEQPATLSGADQQQATITLLSAPDGTYPNVKVEVNGQEVGTMDNARLEVTIHNGSVIQIVNSGETTVFVSVDHNDARLLTPAPGQTVEVDAGQTAQFPSIQFMN